MVTVPDDRLEMYIQKSEPRSKALEESLENLDPDDLFYFADKIEIEENFNLKTSFTDLKEFPEGNESAVLYALMRAESSARIACKNSRNAHPTALGIRKEMKDIRQSLQVLKFIAGLVLIILIVFYLKANPFW